jgi:hypothetical protein
MAITIGRSRDRDDRLKKANTFVLLKVYSNTRNKITTFFLISQPKNVPAPKKRCCRKIGCKPTFVTPRRFRGRNRFHQFWHDFHEELRQEEWSIGGEDLKWRKEDYLRHGW